jgi:hypothetical protein
MNLATKLIKYKAGLLRLAEQSNNVTQACKYLGTSRDRFAGSNNCTTMAVKQDRQ